MKKLIAFTLVVLLAQAAHAQSAGNKKPEALSPKMMEAYAMKAESKTAEFFNYLGLLTDPDANAEMKARTIAEAAKLYQTNAVTVENVFEEKGNITTVKDLLDTASVQKQKINFFASSFNVMPRTQNKKRRDWFMTYELLVGSKVLYISQSFFMVLEDKKFGNNTKKVWNSYLGEMRVTK